MAEDFNPFEEEKKPAQKGKIVLVVGLVAFLVCAAVAVAWYALSPKQELDQVTGCPMEKGSIAPVSHTVVLVDETDPLTAIQADFFEAQMEQTVREMPAGGLLSVYTITEDPAESRKPLIEVCKPRDGSDANALTENERKMQKRFKKSFAEPVRQLVDELAAARSPGEASPIMEAIQFVSVNSFKKRDVQGERRLILFSDMLQNTKAFSLYESSPSIERFKKSDYAAQTKTYLPGVDVSLYYFATRPELQGYPNVDFWKAYFKGAQARVDTVVPVGK